MNKKPGTAEGQGMRNIQQVRGKAGF